MRVDLLQDIGKSTVIRGRASLSAMLFLAAALVFAGIGAAHARDFSCSACDRKAAAVDRCLRMDPSEYATGQLFGSPGKKSYFKRSSCLQAAALKYLDASLCEDVRERDSLFFDGSGISREACMQSVAEKIRATPPVVIRDPYRLAEVEYFRNGNGRDVDVRIAFSGSYRHRYELTVAMVGEAGAAVGTLHRAEHSLGPSTRELQVWITQEKIAAAAEALALQPPYRFRVTLAMVEPGLAEVEQFASMPREALESSVDRVLDPDALERAPAVL